MLLLKLRLRVLPRGHITNIVDIRVYDIGTIIVAHTTTDPYYSHYFCGDHDHEYDQSYDYDSHDYYHYAYTAFTSTITNIMNYY